jgi:phosphoglucomutase
VDSDAANQLVDKIRSEFIDQEIKEDDSSDIALVSAEEFSYTDPVDGSTASKQGLILGFRVGGDPARVVFRLSGTGSAGATIRMYLEKFEADVSKHGQAAPVALKSLADKAVELVQMKALTGREAPTVIT